MDDADLKTRAIALYDRFTHGGQDRRAFMADMTRLAGSAAAAQVLIATIAADPATATMIAEDDKRLDGKMVHWKGAGGHQLFGYMAIPKKHAKKPAAVLVVHENRGLQPYTKDVARRLAVAGFVGLALDFLAPQGGTPLDEDKARQMIGALDLNAATADGVATIDWLAADKLLNGKVGVVGFCWGGAMANRLAVNAGKALRAACAFYGPPQPPADAARVQAAMLLHYAGSDDRVNAGAGPWVDALKAAHADVRRFDYPGTQHAFHNDSSAARYNAEAANLAWDRTIAFFREKFDVNTEELIFYHNPRSRAQMVHFMLEELGVPYRTVIIDFQAGESRQPTYLAINPMGKVPAIVHRGVTVTETGAIIAYLADAFPQAGLAPAVDDPARGTWLRWIVFGAGVFEPALLNKLMKQPEVPRATAGFGSYEDAIGALDVMLRPGPWILGDRYSAADVYVGAELAWAASFGAPGIDDNARLAAYVERIKARPAYQRTMTAA